MTGTAKAKPARAEPSSNPWGSIQPGLRVLHITTRKRPGAWLAEAFVADSPVEIVLEEAVGTKSALARLRDEVFDAILISHVPGELNALELVAGYRAGGAEEPIIVLGIESEQEMTGLCFEAGADGYVCTNTAVTRNLVWIVIRAVERFQLIGENRRLAQADQHRLQRDRDEAERLLEQQRAMIGDVESIQQRVRSLPARRGFTPGLDYAFPTELVAHYRELLRTYVIMGSGNLAQELHHLAEMMVGARLTAPQVMQLHVSVLEELVRGLGTRSTRHVMSRADLLALELMVHLIEGYRHRYEEYLYPPVQQMLPGF